MNQQDRSRSRARAIIITTYKNVEHPKINTSIPSIPPINHVSTSDTRTNHESVTLAWLDLQSSSTPLMIASLRSVNDFIQIHTDVSTSFEQMKNSTEKIFLILSSSQEDLIRKFHGIDNIEAIFIFDTKTASMEHEYPKLMGFFMQHEELIPCLKYTLDRYEQIQLEAFTFDNENAFLWIQLWKDELMTRKVPVNNKKELLDMARMYYRNNSRRLQWIDDFERTYRPKDALRWCFRSPFPFNLLRHAFICQDFEQLSFFRFLTFDASRIIQQPSKSRGFLQLYRGMKLPTPVVNRFETRIGQLVCTSNFFLCTKSRAFALEQASSPGYRSDLISILFKIECDSTVKVSPTSIQNRPSMFVFDIGTTFRLLCFSRNTMIVIKMKAVAGEGKRIVQQYKETHRGVSIPVLLKQLREHESNTSINFSSPENEREADELIKNGKIEPAINILQRIQPVSVPILLRLGHLYADKQGDYENALTYYTQALKLQEKNGEDISETVTRIGTIHYERRDYDSALTCHACALRLRESIKPSNQAAMATNLIGIANAHRANHELSEALIYAKRALALREAIQPRNEILVANTLATLANIYHELNDTNQALEIGQRALDIFQRTLPANAPELAGLLNNLAAMKLAQGATLEARQYFERAIHIYQQTYPSTHPYIIKLENNIRYVDELLKENE